MDQNVFKFIIQNKFILCVVITVIILIIGVSGVIVLTATDSSDSNPNAVYNNTGTDYHVNADGYKYMPQTCEYDNKTVVINDTELIISNNSQLEKYETINLQYPFTNLSNSIDYPTFGWYDKETIYYTSKNHLVLFNTHTKAVKSTTDFFNQINFEEEVKTEEGLKNNYIENLVVNNYIVGYSVKSQKPLETKDNANETSGIDTEEDGVYYSTFIKETSGNQLYATNKKLDLIPFLDSICYIDNFLYTPEDIFDADKENQMFINSQERKSVENLNILAFNENHKEFVPVSGLCHYLKTNLKNESAIATIKAIGRDVFVLTYDISAGKKSFKYHKYNLNSKVASVYNIDYTPLSFSNYFSSQIMFNGDLIINVSSSLLPDTLNVFKFDVIKQSLNLIHTEKDTQSKELEYQKKLVLNKEGSMFFYREPNPHKVKVIKKDFSVLNNIQCPSWEEKVPSNFKTAMPFPRGSQKVDVTFTSDLNSKIYTVNNFEKSSVFFEDNTITKEIYSANSDVMLINPVINQKGDYIAVFAAQGVYTDDAEPNDDFVLNSKYYTGKLIILKRNNAASNEWTNIKTFPEGANENFLMNYNDLNVNDYFWDSTGTYLALNFINHNTYIYNTSSNSYYNLLNKENHLNTANSLLPMEGSFSDDSRSFMFLSVKSGTNSEKDDVDEDEIVLKQIYLKNIHEGSSKIANLDNLDTQKKQKLRLSVVFTEKETIIICPYYKRTDTSYNYKIDLKTKTIVKNNNNYFGGVLSSDNSSIIFGIYNYQTLPDPSILPKPYLERNDIYDSNSTSIYIFDRVTNEGITISGYASEFKFSLDKKSIIMKTSRANSNYQIYSINGDLINSVDIPVYYGRPPVMLPGDIVFANEGIE